MTRPITEASVREACALFWPDRPMDIELLDDGARIGVVYSDKIAIRARIGDPLIGYMAALHDAINRSMRH